MPTFNSRQYTGMAGINLREANGCIRFEVPLITPITTSGECILYRSGTDLVWDNGSTTITLANAAGVATTWEQLYTNDKTLTIDSTSLTFALTHATNDGLTITASAGSSGDCIQITNSGSGNDIEGTSGLWAVTAAGAATLVSIAGCDSLTANANLALEANGAGTISIGATSSGAIDIGTGGGAVTLATAVTAALGITITAGGLLSSDGIVDVVDNANNASTLRATNDTQTTYGNASDAGMVVFRSESISTGALLHLSLDETALAGGFFLRCWSQDAGAAAFTIGELGATVIAGSAVDTASLTQTKGDHVISDGCLLLTSSSATASISVTNDTVTTLGAAADAGAVDISSESLSTGALLNLSLDETALTTGWYFRCWGQDAAASVFTIGEYGATVITTAAAATSLTITTATTNVDAVSIIGSALTTGDLVYLGNTAETLAAGEMLKINNTENGDFSATPKTGNLASITSSCTMTTNSATLDYDTLLISRSNIANQGTKTLTAQGSVLKLMNTSTNTAGTCTDTTVILEILAVDGGTAAPTGTCAQITSVGVGAKALDVISASTTVDDVLITGSGVKASTKASLQVVNSGNTAAGGSILRVASGASTPAAATSYLAEFTYAASTMTNNPITMQINGGASTGAVVNVTGSGAGYSLATYNTNTGATGVQWFTEHTSTGSAADNDVVFSLLLGGLSDTNVARQYGAIKVTAIDVSNATEDGKLDLQVMVAGTLTSLLYVQSSVAGATTMVCAAAATTFTGSAAGTAAATITNGDLALSAGRITQTTTADIYGLDVTVNKATATQGVAVFTNASATSGKAVLELEQADLDQPYIKMTGANTITSANAGANGDVPAQVREYVLIETASGTGKMPVYAV